MEASISSERMLPIHQPTQSHHNRETPLAQNNEYSRIKIPGMQLRFGVSKLILEADNKTVNISSGSDMKKKGKVLPISGNESQEGD
jgi:hypothetical protein